MLRTLFEGLAGIDAKRAANRFRRALIDFAIAGAALLIGLAFLVAAAFIYAAGRYEPGPAALGFGFGFILLSAIILLVHRTLSALRARREREDDRRDQIKSLATAVVIAAAPALIRSTGIVGAVVLPLAAIAAYAIYRENSRPGNGTDDY